MNAISPPAWFQPDDARRASPRRERFSCGSEDGGGDKGPWLSALRLIAHLAITSLVFLALMTLVWLVSWAFSTLQARHPFPEELMELFITLKFVLVYLDVLMSSIVLLYGICRYILTVLQGDS